MVIDMHYHYYPAYSEETANRVAGVIAHAGRFMGRETDEKVLAKKLIENADDPTGEKVMTWMEDTGVDFVSICCMDYLQITNMTDDSVRMQNKKAGNLAQSYPDKMMALAGIDPRRPQAADMMKQCFEEFGMKGLKFRPDFGYDPNSPESYKLLEVIDHYKGVLLTHTGPFRPPMRAKYSEPALLADLPIDFPNIKIIAAHMGFINWRPWASLAFYFNNLYGDVASWDAFAYKCYPTFCRELRNILDLVGPSKVVFGSDAPILHTLWPTKEWIQLFKDLPENAADGIVFTQQEVNAILGDNAEKLLGLKEKA